jgi:hypothetical protein
MVISYAMDARHGRFYMNYEDKDLTTAIDLETHQTVAKWQPNCGPDGPHGLQIDQTTGYLFVACSTEAKVLSAGGNGRSCRRSTQATASTTLIIRPQPTCCRLEHRKTASLRWRR